jgi:hypothetical protein
MGEPSTSRNTRLEIAPARTHREPPFRLRFPVPANDVDEGLVEFDDTATGVRFLLLAVVPVRAAPYGTADRDRGRFEVDVGPCARDQFPWAHSGERGDVPERRVVVLGDVFEEAAELLVAPCRRRARAGCASPRRPCFGRDAAGNMWKVSLAHSRGLHRARRPDSTSQRPQ